MDILISLLCSLALVSYIIQEIIKYYNQRKLDTIIVVVIAGIFGLLISFSYGVNMLGAIFHVFGNTYEISLFSSVVGEIITGLCIGVGSGLFYDLISKYRGDKSEQEEAE